jgi:hypothetical protein
MIITAKIDDALRELLDDARAAVAVAQTYLDDGRYLLAAGSLERAVGLLLRAHEHPENVV